MFSQSNPRLQLRRRSFALAGLLLATCLLVGCPASPVKPGPEQQVSNATVSQSSQATLINEGGVVFFTVPGAVRLPSFFVGHLTSLTVHADRLDGGPFPKVAAASVAADGSFSLTGPLTSRLFFATSDFQPQDVTYRVRALARAEGGEPLVLDPASTLVSAKIALAAQRSNLDGLDYTQTRELTAELRSSLGTALDTVGLDQPDETMSHQLDDLARAKPALAANLAKWQALMEPVATPVPTSAPSGPPPSARPTPAISLDPVK